MSIEGLVFALILLVGVIALVALPAFSRDAAPSMALANKQHERLELYYERVLRNMRDLDEDFALGKLDEADYRAERELWAERGVQVLKALDTERGTVSDMLPPSAANVEDDAAVDRAIDDAIERAIRTYRAKDAGSLADSIAANQQGQ